VDGENDIVINLVNGIFNNVVTVIICCHNSEKTVGDTLATLLAQSYINLAVLVIDDASTDDSADVVQCIAKGDPRVRLLFNDRNRGTAYTRMRGLTEAGTDLVMFFDSDDLAEPDLVSRLVYKMLGDESILGVSCYARYFNDAGDLGIQRIGPTSKEAFFDLYRRCKLVFILPVTLFHRQDALEVGGYRLGIMPNDEGIRYEDYSEDVDLWCRMSDFGAQGRYFITIPEPLFRYRKLSGSLSARNVRLMQLKMRWIKDCLTLRRAGAPERSLAHYVASRSWFDRINDYRSDLAAKFYKLAGFAYSDRNYFKLGVYLALTGLFSPKLIRQKIKTQTTRPAD
jgi:glycosyltransferase involved in cell wall biosynthesis